jgi:hypothetical protein
VVADQRRGGGREAGNVVVAWSGGRSIGWVAAGLQISGAGE